jgi:hypothetical protein
MLRLAIIALLATSACHATPSLAAFEPSARSSEARDPAPDLEGQAPPAPASQAIPTPPKSSTAPSGDSSRVLDLDDLEGNAWAGLLGFSGDYHSDPKFAAGVLVRAPSPLLSRGLFGMKRDDLGIYLQAGAGSLDRDVDTTDDTRGAVLLGALGVDYRIVRSESWMFLAQAGMQYVGVKDVASANDGVGFVVGGLGGFALTDRLWITVNPQFILGDGDYLYLVSLGLHYSF